MSDPYLDFLRSKAARAPMRGLESVPELASHLFPFQRHCVDFALRAGASGCFLDTGLGKTEVQIEWCRHAAAATNGRALILTPLAVAGQTKRRAERWGYEARVIREQADAGPGINICNYDRLGKLNPDWFGAVSLDEASILKNYTGRTSRALISAFSRMKFRLAATATPAPNDHMELGQYSEFLGVMPSNEMLMRWFIADQTNMGKYRLKGHAVRDFWGWLASWARSAERPSDLGDSDSAFNLGPFRVIRHRARDSEIEGALADLFGTVRMSATTMHDVKRQTSAARAEVAASLISSERDEPWLVWVDTDYEADAVRNAVTSAVEIRGSQHADEKEEKLAAFADGSVKHLIGKPSMLGFGLDWSHCARMVFVGRSFSYETWYQAVRRCWRFGQKREVQVHLVVAEGEGEIGRVIDRKSEDHEKMRKAMRGAMANSSESAALKVAYDPRHFTELPPWIASAA